ncbi:hypothetical protein MAPG_09411 [Magnaporthiopsis poae ATCC 64411]|uniref:Uncharacterized protein n=1 Tax=Magnaporthiopsis poae (strain ATCC 64411 / 73-15) TaxID=644358 RepID=A0A0C4E9W1_MAGP6|nr:hypothetical protein MAPG_09411 [Magnaporthiopsis poae ATCC 64411]
MSEAAMPVSQELAFKWECGHFTDPKFRPPDQVTRSFIEARTKPWEDRLKDYWAWYEEKEDLGQPSPQDQRAMQLHLSQTLSVEPRQGDGFLVRRLKRWIGNHRLESERKRRIGTEFHGFTSLPTEIRTMIYKYALVTPSGKFLMPPKKDGKFKEISIDCMVAIDGTIYQIFEEFVNEDLLENQRLLTLGLLLCVSRAVQSEAEAVFFGGNMMVFTNSSPMASDDDSGWWIASLDRVRLQLRRISIALVASAVYIPEDFGVRFWGDDVPNLRKHLNDGDTLLYDEERDTVRQAAHRNSHDRVSWYTLRNLSQFPNLELVEISIEEANCLAGCCRNLGVIFRSLWEPYMSEFQNTPAPCPPKAIKFVGWKDTGEQDRIRKRLEGSEAFRETEIIFGGAMEQEEDEEEDEEDD